VGGYGFTVDCCGFGASSTGSGVLIANDRSATGGGSFDGIIFSFFGEQSRGFPSGVQFDGSADGVTLVNNSSGPVAMPFTNTSFPSTLDLNQFSQRTMAAHFQSGVVIGSIDSFYINGILISQVPLPATVIFGNLNQTYTGTACDVTISTIPSNLLVNLTYDGSPNAPTNAGSYTVIGTVSNANYQGSATNTLVISKATATVTLGNLSQMYDGTAKSATATTEPPGLAVTLTYTGSVNAPTNAGSHTVIGVVSDANYAGSTTNTLVIVRINSFAVKSYSPTLNPLTGLYEERLVVTNTGSPFAALRLIVGNLPANVSLYNIAGTTNGLPYAQFNVSMPNGASGAFLLQFYNAHRINFTNTVQVVGLIETLAITNGITGVPITEVHVDTNNPDNPRFTFAFSSVVGRPYQVLYSDDRLQTWTIAATLNASSTWTIWTEILPPANSRFFKVIVAP
jgi:hypothetical protein